MSKHRWVEQRLFEAVAVVLASSPGCYTSAPPQQPAPSPAPPAAATPDPWAGTAATPLKPPDPSLPPPVKARELCALRKATPLKARPPMPSNPYANAPATGEASTWDGGRDIALCTIVRDTQSAPVQVTYTPRCCPSPDPNYQPPPCPPSLTENTTGELRLVETAEVGPDGKLLASTLRWDAIKPYRAPQPYCGRLPEGARALGAVERGDQLERILAGMAELEAASVPAFERLARELAAHGAPAKLVRRARAAMRDEIRHAQMLEELASRYGAAPRSIEVDEVGARSLLAIAIENVVEGCVREAYGALVATYQAERAPGELRGVFRTIARDERRHAALAEDVHAWVIAQLDTGERAQVDAVRARAEAELRASLPAMPACPELGMPAAAHALALFDGYFVGAPAPIQA